MDEALLLEDVSNVFEFKDKPIKPRTVAPDKAGLGAWSFGFYHEGMTVPNSRVSAGIKAFKRALIDNGFAIGINPTSGTFGAATKVQTIDFQKAQGITADGVIGPETARYLFRIYAYAAEQGGTIEIPDHLLHKLGCHESGHDPVAQGYIDLHDEGEDQISLTNHPNITQAEAWRPRFSIPWAATDLKTFYVNKVADFDGALASYNVGTFYAVQWVNAGKPGSGGPIIDGQDIYSRAAAYVAGVKVMPA